MRGLRVGEAVSTTNPAIQFFARDGGFLSDPYAASFIIEDIHDPSASPTIKVASTPLTASEKIATGRYVLPTGATNAWSVGTHRAVVTYQMESGGPSYVQVIEFEMLTAADWPSSASYSGYISTKQALEDSIVSSTTTRAKMHRLISELSYNIERWTGRWFEPRYVHLRTNGKAEPILLLDSPIIAIEDVYSIWKTTSGEDEYKFEQYLYKVYNRHLDGLSEQDDRKNPHIELTDVTGTIVRVSGFAWPYGNQNVRVQGVFGYTDPDHDPSANRVLLGHTPRDIARAAAALLYKYVQDPTLTGVQTWYPGGVSSMKTRHQSISWGSMGGTATSGSLSGDPLVDSILIKYRKPFAMGAI